MSNATVRHKDAGTKDDAEIRALVAAWSAAVEAKDSEALVANYTPDTVLFDAIPPYRSVGADAIKAIWDKCLPFFPERFKSEHRDLSVTIDGDLAVVFGLHHFKPDPTDHPAGSTWMRITLVFKRDKGTWQVLHEHVSIPFDPMSGKATFITIP